MHFARLQCYVTAIAVLCCFLSNNTLAQISYTWNGNLSSSWNQPSNWTPNGVPTDADDVSIASAGANQLILDTSYRVANLSVSGGTLNLNGFILTTAGTTGTFSGGTIVNGTLQLSLSGAATFSGTNFGAALKGSAGGLLFNGSTFNQVVDLTKTGSSTDLCTGNNTFNSTASITNSGTSYIRLANSTRDVFNADVTFTNTGTSYIDVARHDANGTMFNGNIIVNNTGGSGINFGQGTGLAVLAAGKTIVVGDIGFTAGTLALRNFVQQGDTPQNIRLSGSSTLSFQTGSSFSGPVTAVAPSMALNGSIFNNNTTVEKTGSASNTSLGGNTFNGKATIINSGSNFLRLANSTRDIFNDDVTFTNTGSSYIDVARHDGTGTEFNGNIFVNSTAGTGIQFCQGNGTARMAEGKTIRTGNLGFTSGTLALRFFTQTGSTPQSLTLSGSGIVSFQTGTVFNAPVTVASPGIILSGTTFNTTVSFEKTGTGNNYGTGGNTFNGTATFTNSSTGVLYLNNTGTDVYNENIIVNSTANGSIRFGQSTGTATLAAGKTISIGAAGFSNGSLMLRNFTQLGNEAINLTATGSGIISFQAGTVIGGNVVIVSPGLTLDGATFNGTASFTKTGASHTSAGGNTFNGITSITNNGNGFLRLSNTTRDTFNADVTFSNASSSYIDVARNDATGTVFNGNIFVNSTSGTGIYFCQSTGTGTAVLAAGKTISVGNTGFTAGGLYLRNFTQAGTTPQSIVLGGTASQLHFLTGTVFNGNLTATAPTLILSGSTFNGAATLTKTGSAANTGAGGCTFNGSFTIINNGSGALTLANVTGDDFNATAHFVQRGSGLLQPAFNGTSTFAGDISTEGTIAAINFANGATGRVVIDGTAPQFFYGDAALPPQVQRLTMATSEEGKLVLLVNLSVVNDIAFTTGIIQAVNTGANDKGLLILQSGTSISDAPDNGSHVTGFVRKVGNTAFTFPTGSGTAYRPLSITAPLLASDHFTTAYFKADPDRLYPRSSRKDGINYLSHLEYWVLERTGGSAKAQITLTWDGQSNVTDPQSLLIARWDGSGWVNAGNGGITEEEQNGTIGSEGEMNAFGPFTFGSFFTPFQTNEPVTQSTLPVELVNFTATPKEGEVLLKWKTASEKDNDYFTVERSANGKQFEEVTLVRGSGNSNVHRTYEVSDSHPYAGTSYYRLKQTDYNGAFRYAAVVSVDRKSNFQQEASIYPNPSDGATISVTVPSQAGKDLIISIVDAQGRVVFSTKVLKPAADRPIVIKPTQKLMQGIYIVNITSSTGTCSKKLVVQ